MGLKTIAIKLNSDPETIENDIEPLLLKLGKIEKSSRGRIRI
jgi:Holliday junction resolvasome RuvABC ATP-dependent DNA helicase subunit